MAEGGENVQVEHKIPKPVLANIAPPPNLDMTGDLQGNWRTWKQMWENYSTLAQISEYDEKYQRASFLYAIGSEANRVYASMEFGPAERRDIKTIIGKLDAFVIGERNETYERYVFNNRIQKQDESFDVFLTAVRTLSKSCNFCECLRETLIRDRVVIGIYDSKTRRRLLQDSKLTLKSCIDMCRSAEATSARLKVMHNSHGATSEEVNKISRFSHKHHGKKKEMPNTKKKQHHSTRKSCLFCGYEHVMIRDKCPAWGKTCSVCKEKNHYSKMCRHARKIHAVEPDVDYSDSDSNEDVGYISTITTCNQVAHQKPKGKGAEIYAKMVVEEKHETVPVRFQVDCGASVNILPKQYLVDKTDFGPTDLTLRMWNNAIVHPDGVTRRIVKNPRNDKRYNVEFVIVGDEVTDFTPLLGSKAAQQMDLLTVNSDNFVRVNKVVGPDVAAAGKERSETAQQIVDKYTDVFKGEIGNLPGKVTLRVDTEVQPNISHQNRVPVSQRDSLKVELNRLMKLGVIVPVDEPTNWVSSMVIAEKSSGGMRICIDPQQLNKALKREHYTMPTIEELLPELSEAKVFSTCDLSAGFWHLKLDEESSKLCTFGTPFGRYRWTRLPFGLSVSPEIFQKRLIQALEGLPGVQCIADDILICGKGATKEIALADHNKNLDGLLHRCEELGIKLKKEKLKLCKDEVKFLGHVISSSGLKPDPEKVRAVTDMEPPQGVEDVQRIAGFVNYLAKFLPGLSDVMSPLRKLTHSDVPWTWTDTHQAAFQEVKDLVTQAPVLAYYDHKKDLILQTDASSKGLGAALIQDGRPVAYASRLLTETETRYAQIEKEMLSVVYGLEKFHTYTYGRTVKVENDHKPLEAISRKPLHLAPKRLQAMLLRLQKYTAEIHYRKGKEVVLADTLSRASLPNREKEMKFGQINMAKFLPITENRLKQIRQETEKDEILQKLKLTIQQGWPEDKQHLPTEITPYFHCRDELTVQNGLIFRGERVVIPQSQRTELKAKVHTSHIGIEGCLRRARECLYWPNMSSDIKEYISTCETCSKFQCDQQPESLMPHDVPERPWQRVACDLFTLHDKNYIITVDYYSNFWEIDRLNDTKSTAIIHKLKGHFSRYGIPDQLISDNGPQFVSDEFHRFSVNWDFEHLTSSPYNSKGNGKAESAVKMAKRLLRKARESGGDEYMAVLDYRNTPTQGVGTSPVQRLMNRRSKTLLPTHAELLKPRVVASDRDKLKARQYKQKQLFDRHSKDLKPLEEEDVVRIKPFLTQDKVWKKGTIQRRLDERSYEVVTDDGSLLRRNRVHMRQSKEKPTPSVPTRRESPQPMLSRPTTWRTEISSKPAVTPTEQRVPAKSEEMTSPVTPQETVRTRSGRESKRPERFKDYDV